jgi:hypothetical protein
MGDSQGTVHALLRTSEPHKLLLIGQTDDTLEAIEIEVRTTAALR